MIIYGFSAEVERRMWCVKLKWWGWDRIDLQYCWSLRRLITDRSRVRLHLQVNHSHWSVYWRSPMHAAILYHVQCSVVRDPRFSTFCFQYCWFSVQRVNTAFKIPIYLFETDHVCSVLTRQAAAFNTCVDSASFTSNTAEQTAGFS